MKSIKLFYSAILAIAIGFFSMPVAGYISYGKFEKTIKHSSIFEQLDNNLPASFFDETSDEKKGLVALETFQELLKKEAAKETKQFTMITATFFTAVLSLVGGGLTFFRLNNDVAKNMAASLGGIGVLASLFGWAVSKANEKERSKLENLHSSNLLKSYIKKRHMLAPEYKNYIEHTLLPAYWETALNDFFAFEATSYFNRYMEALLCLPLSRTAYTSDRKNFEALLGLYSKPSQEDFLSKTTPLFEGTLPANKIGLLLVSSRKNYKAHAIESMVKSLRATKIPVTEIPENPTQENFIGSNRSEGSLLLVYTYGPNSVDELNQTPTILSINFSQDFNSEDIQKTISALSQSIDSKTGTFQSRFLNLPVKAPLIVLAAYPEAVQDINTERFEYINLDLEDNL